MSGVIVKQFSSGGGDGDSCIQHSNGSDCGRLMEECD